MEYTIVGKITNTHGVRGEVKVYPLTNDLKRFDQIKSLYIGDGKIKVQLDSVKYHKNLAILRFKEFDDINQILIYKNEYIYVDEVEKIILPEDHFFIYDLLECKVFNKDDDLIGIVTDVLQNHSNDIYVVKNMENNKEYLIPAIKEFVSEVNITEKRIIITPIEGMIQ